MYQVYILQSSKDFRTYIGYSSNVTLRLKEHNLGKVQATRYRRPFKILFIEKAGSLIGAKKREKYWKSGAGRRKLKTYFSVGSRPV